MPPNELHVTKRGSGQRLVLVHGFTQSAASWEPVAAEIGEGFEIVTPDLPGHGSSPPAVGGLGVAADLLGQACAKGTYVGYSLGGRTCLHLALRRPILVDRLVIVSASAGIEDLDIRTERRLADEALADRIVAGGDENLPEFIDEWLDGPLFNHLSRHEADRPARLVNTAAGLASSLRFCGAGTQLPLWQQVRSLEMPVLVVAGEKDKQYVELGERLAASIGPNALLVLAPGAGHSVPYEQPAAFAALVTSFALGQLAAPTGS